VAKRTLDTRAGPSRLEKRGKVGAREACTASGARKACGRRGHDNVTAPGLTRWKRPLPACAALSAQRRAKHRTLRLRVEREADLSTAELAPPGRERSLSHGTKAQPAFGPERARPCALAEDRPPGTGGRPPWDGAQRRGSVACAAPGASEAGGLDGRLTSGTELSGAAGIADRPPGTNTTGRRLSRSPDRSVRGLARSRRDAARDRRRTTMGRSSAELERSVRGFARSRSGRPGWPLNARDEAQRRRRDSVRHRQGLTPRDGGSAGARPGAGAAPGASGGPPPGIGGR